MADTWKNMVKAEVKRKTMTKTEAKKRIVKADALLRSAGVRTG